MILEGDSSYVNWVQNRKFPIDFAGFSEHCQPLHVQAKGRVMIIGPSMMSLEELALIEDSVTNKSISEIVMIGENPVFYHIFIDIFQKYHPDIKILGEPIQSYDNYFLDKPNAQFDTILFICIPLSYPTETIQFLGDHLSTDGHIYLTINSFDPPEILPIENLNVQILDEPLPPHPYYRGSANYYGVIGFKNII
jgi:hypothetical protein